jgi:hypothetical protein
MGDTLLIGGEPYRLDRESGGGPGVWITSPRGTRYRLEPALGGLWRCRCPDAFFRRHPSGCKHALAVSEFMSREAAMSTQLSTQNVKPSGPDPLPDLAALAAPFEPSEVKWKPQVVSGNRAMCIAYIDARLVMDRLDEVFGVLGWQDTYEVLPDGGVTCRLRVRLGGGWVEKMDVGSPSDQPDEGDKRKAAFSDALKRCAVKFGVGRYLYRLPQQWVDYDPQKRRITGTPRLPPEALPAGKTRPAPAPERAPGAPLMASTSQRDEIDELQEALGLPTAEFFARMERVLGHRRPDRLTAAEAEKLIHRMRLALDALEKDREPRKAGMA